MNMRRENPDSFVLMARSFLEKVPKCQSAGLPEEQARGTGKETKNREFRIQKSESRIKKYAAQPLMTRGAPVTLAAASK
jgi:hypothetical protein